MEGLGPTRQPTLQPLCHPLLREVPGMSACGQVGPLGRQPTARGEGAVMQAEDFLGPGGGGVWTHPPTLYWGRTTGGARHLWSSRVLDPVTPSHAQSRQVTPTEIQIIPSPRIGVWQFLPISGCYWRFSAVFGLLCNVCLPLATFCCL